MHAVVVQCALCAKAFGMEISPLDFGAPPEFAEELATLGSSGVQDAPGDMLGMIDGNAGNGARQAIRGF